MKKMAVIGIGIPALGAIANLIAIGILGGGMANVLSFIFCTVIMVLNAMMARAW